MVDLAWPGFGCGFGLPRWVLTFLKGRREKTFTNDFAERHRHHRAQREVGPAHQRGAQDRRAAKCPIRSAANSRTLIEGLKVGVTLEQGLKRMYENMPTAEVSFFAIVMTIQQKSGGNLSEALSNLANVLRDRKRLQGKIKAMSSEAKASAAIIGSLPPAVMVLVCLSTPTYIETLFTTRTGNLMLAACVVWMSSASCVMQKMISFKH